MSSFSGAVTLAADAPVAVAASGTFSLIWLLIGLPLLGALILLVGGRRTNAFGHWLGVLASAASFVVAAVLFFAMLGQPIDGRTQRQHLFDWISVGTFKVPADLRLDQLSMTFVLLITGVGTLIHLYSVGYMSHDKDRRKFFGYLNLFVASMLLLVLADNYLLLYVGWEGVDSRPTCSSDSGTSRRPRRSRRRRRSSSTASVTSDSSSGSCSSGPSSGP